MNTHNMDGNFPLNSLGVFSGRSAMIRNAVFRNAAVTIYPLLGAANQDLLKEGA